MQRKSLKIHPGDNLEVALTDLTKGSKLRCGDQDVVLVDSIPGKHKFALKTFKPDDEIIMFGVLVGKAVVDIPVGSLITTENIRHASDSFKLKERKTTWHVPDTTGWRDKTFMGHHRADGSVGTANYWLVIPLVFCENKNVDVMQEAFSKALGYAPAKSPYEAYVEKLIQKHSSGNGADGFSNIPSSNSGSEILFEEEAPRQQKIFPNIDGIKFLNHTLGCGGTRQDARTLCGLLAGYITHSNVAGATILSLGCQNAQISILQEEIALRDPAFSKPMYILEQQQIGNEKKMLQQAISQTFEGLIIANKSVRKPAPLSKLCIGLECGGSDGFSGISANPAIGYTSDLLVALGGSVILSEFPELCGVEQELSDRCVTPDIAERFMQLMKTYNERATAVGSGFYANPSPGNIKDGLITDAIKSAGAAKKGGSSPVVAVLDYPEKVNKPGLTLLCTPGGDIESTTAEVGSGANIVLFTTGLGTPTGNPITPVLKVSTNTLLYKKMNDIIDIDTGEIIAGNESIEEAGARILQYVIDVASGTVSAKAVAAGHDDFIPWKRGISL